MTLIVFIFFPPGPILNFYAHSFCFFNNIFNTTNKTECIFWKVIVFTFKNFFEAFNCFCYWYVRTFLTCELFSNVEVL